MVDVLLAIRDYLLLAGEVTALTGTRIYAGRNAPPREITPGDGPLITFRIRGGSPDYEDALQRPSVQIKCYAATEWEAEQLFLALHAHLQNARGEQVAHAELESLGGQLEESGTGWFYTLSFWKAMIRMK